MALIKAIVNVDGSGLVEGQAGAVSQMLPGNVPLTATLAAGWKYNRDLVLAGWKFTTFDDATLGAVPQGMEVASYGVAASALTRTLQEPPLPILDLPQILSFVRRAGLESIYTAAITAANASPTEAVRFAADTLTKGNVFRFDRTMVAAASVISLLGIPDAPNFADATLQTGLKVHWRAAAAAALPGIV